MLKLKKYITYTMHVYIINFIYLLINFNNFNQKKKEKL